MPTKRRKSHANGKNQCACLTKTSGFVARCRRASATKGLCSQHRNSPACRPPGGQARTPAPAHSVPAHSVMTGDTGGGNRKGGEKSKGGRNCKGVDGPRTCFDFVMYSDEEVEQYLQQDEDNIVVVVDAGADTQEAFCYTRKQLADTLRTNRRVFACATDTDRIEAAVPHIEYAPVQLRDAVLVHASTLQAAIKQTRHRVILLSRTGFVPRLVSHDVLDVKLDSSVGGRHCQPSSGGMSYAASVPIATAGNGKSGKHPRACL